MTWTDTLLAGLSNPNTGKLINLAGDVLGGASAAKTNNMATTIASQANPFAQYRPQYGAQLAKMMADPSAFENDPAYQFTRDQGLNAVAAKMGASGYGGSTNEADGLVQYASGVASTYRGQELDRLANLAGAGITPANMGVAVNAQNSAMQQGGAVLNDVGSFFAQPKTPGTPGTTATPGSAGDPNGDLSPVNIDPTLDKYYTAGDDARAVARGDMTPSSAGGGDAVSQATGLAGVGKAAYSAYEAAPTVGSGIVSGASAAVNAMTGGLTTGLGTEIGAGLSSAGSAVEAALASNPIGWGVAAVAALGAIVANNGKKESALDGHFDMATSTFTKPVKVGGTQLSADQLNSLYGSALKTFSDTGDITKALATIPKPANAAEAKVIGAGLRALFDGTGNPFRVIAKQKGYGKGAWTAGTPQKNALLKQLGFIH